jgi:hypothetical protein
MAVPAIVESERQTGRLFACVVAVLFLSILVLQAI